jgi:hypothetical protein
MDLLANLEKYNNLGWSETKYLHHQTNLEGSICHSFWPQVSLLGSSYFEDGGMRVMANPSTECSVKQQSGSWWFYQQQFLLSKSSLGSFGFAQCSRDACCVYY